MTSPPQVQLNNLHLLKTETLRKQKQYSKVQITLQRHVAFRRVVTSFTCDVSEQRLLITDAPVNTEEYHNVTTQCMSYTGMLCTTGVKEDQMYKSFIQVLVLSLPKFKISSCYLQ